jgi:hypothetical protein
MHNPAPRFPVIQQPPRMANPQPNILNQMTRSREPQKFNPSKTIIDYFLLKI